MLIYGCLNTAFGLSQTPSPVSTKTTATVCKTMSPLHRRSISNNIQKRVHSNLTDTKPIGIRSAKFYATADDVESDDQNYPLDENQTALLAIEKAMALKNEGAQTSVPPKQVAAKTAKPASTKPKSHSSKSNDKKWDVYGGFRLQ
jgi:hypothetical protein